MFYVLLSICGFFTTIQIFIWEAIPYQASYFKDVTVTLQITVMS